MEAANAVKIVDANGKPFAARQSKPSMLRGGSNIPYDAADGYGPHMGDWNPYLWSPDGELNPFRDRIVARVRDLVRNDGWASAAVSSTLDNVIGANFRPISKPDWRALRAMTGNNAFDHMWANEYGQAVEANYRTWAHDPGRYCDLERNLTVPQMSYLGFRHKCVDGDALAMLHWRPGRVGPGRARYATTMQVLDPDRLSNPQLKFDQASFRGGVEIDEDGVATHYHIRRAHPGDYWSGGKSLQWERIPRETSWGRPIIIHDFDHERAGQHRGGAGILTPVLQRLKMLIKYDGTELDAAIVNSFFAAYIESPFDGELVEEALRGSDKVSHYQEERAAYHKERGVRMGQVGITHLYPGEKLGFAAPSRPSANFGEFENVFLRHVAAGAGTSAQMVSQNWADVNYSSYRAAMLEVWKKFHRRRIDFACGFAHQYYSGWLEESMEVDDLPLPRNAPDYNVARYAYSAAKFQGPGRGYADPVKEKAGSILGLDAGLSTLESEASELAGEDWRDLMSQRAVEIEQYRQHGLTPPSWAMGENATKASQDPQAD